MESPIDGELWDRNFKRSHCLPNVVFFKISGKQGSFSEIMYFMEAKLFQREVFVVIKPFVLITQKLFKFNGAVVDGNHHSQSFSS